MTVACLLVGTGLFLPLIRGGSFGQRTPPGQFEADLRTMLAAVHYVCTPEVQQQNPDRKRIAVAQTNWLAYITRDHLMSDANLTTNQLQERADASTNPPSQS